jgi:hypothetical protein
VRNADVLASEDVAQVDLPPFEDLRYRQAPSPHCGGCFVCDPFCHALAGDILKATRAPPDAWRGAYRRSIPLSSRDTLDATTITVLSRGDDGTRQQSERQADRNRQAPLICFASSVFSIPLNCCQARSMAAQISPVSRARTMSSQRDREAAAPREHDTERRSTRTSEKQAETLV